MTSEMEERLWMVIMMASYGRHWSQSWWKKVILELKKVTLELKN